MKLEIHILQNFAPSNLNRDDTGSPKDCELGGVRRARISSQCFKRAIRQAFKERGLLAHDELAARTKRLVLQIADRVVASTPSIERDVAQRAAVRALEAGKLKTDPGTLKTQYLLFLPARAIDALARIVAEHHAVLGCAAADVEPADDDAKKRKATKSRKAEKADAKSAIDPKIQKAVAEVLADSAKTPELALFGRMITDEPVWNVEAACQVAQAISTHRVAMEFDFYTAIDDLKPNDTAASDMMGTVPFTSACFYRYLVVDVADLIKNLGGDDAARAQAKRTMDALIRAAVLAVPTGKQASMAAHNPPSLVLCDVRDKSEPRSLANAFVAPVRPKPGPNGDLVSQSLVKLGEYAKALDDVYGAGDRKDLSYVVLDPDPEESLAKIFQEKLPSAKARGSLDALVSAAVAAAVGGGAA